jgi:DNA-binding response OmpR family regulator
LAQILSFGIVKSFLDERARLLANHGFNVSTVSQKDEMLRLAKMMPPDVVIFGHSVPPGLRSSLSGLIKKINPEVYLVYLYHGSTMGTEMADAILNRDSEPTTLVETLKYLLERRKTTDVGV